MTTLKSVNIKSDDEANKHTRMSTKVFFLCENEKNEESMLEIGNVEDARKIIQWIHSTTQNSLFNDV